MVSFYAPITPTWRPPFNLDGLFHRDELDRVVQQYRDLPLRWSWATTSDWPSQFQIGSDFRHARKHGYGFVVDVSAERLFLVPRGWEEPEWSFAVFSTDICQWRDLGDFEPTPEHWVFPSVEERTARSS